MLNQHIREQSTINKRNVDEIIKLQEEVKKYTEDEFRYKHKYKTQYEIMSKRIEDKQEEITSYQENIKSKDGYIQSYAVENDFRARQEREHKMLIDKMASTNADLNRKVNEVPT